MADELRKAVKYVKTTRCPHCIRKCKPGSKYRLVESWSGGRCYGFRSKHWDERMWKS